MSFLHDRAVPDGNVPVIQAGKHDAFEQPDRYYISISGIWSRACGIYVLWICKEHSVRDRGGRHDRWLYTNPDLLPGRIPNHETDGYHGCNLTGNVDLE